MSEEIRAYLKKLGGLQGTRRQRSMKKEEALLVEHQELVDLYMHQWRSILYVGVSYVICNGALFSLLGLQFTTQQPIFITRILMWVCLAVAIVAGVTFLLWIMKTKVELMSLVNKGVMIENLLQEGEVPFDTFGIFIVSTKRGRFLSDLNGSYAKLRVWQKLDAFKLIYLLWLTIVVSWIAGLVMLYITL